MEPTEIVEIARTGNTEPLWAWLEGHRDRLERMVRFRLHPALRGRVDPADVIQECFVEVTRRLPAYLAENDMPFFLWIRFLANQSLLQIHRKHLDVEGRDARREIALDQSGGPALSALDIARAFAESQATPSAVAGRAEEVERIRATLEEMDDIDREILYLRHFEGLTNSEVSRVLGLRESGASMRYLRALERLGSLLGGE